MFIPCLPLHSTGNNINVKDRSTCAERLHVAYLNPASSSNIVTESQYINMLMDHTNGSVELCVGFITNTADSYVMVVYRLHWFPCLPLHVAALCFMLPAEGVGWSPANVQISSV